MKYDDAFDALAALPPSRWNWHEKSLCRRIGLKATSDASSTHNELVSFVQAYENLDGRGTGDKSTGNKDAPSSNLTFHDLHVRHDQHGVLEAFATPKLDTREHVNVRPRWFQIGGATVPIKRQLAMIREIKGEDHRLDVATKQRRQRTWKSWANGSRSEDVSKYVDVDLRAIVFKYQKEIYGDDDDGAIESADELTRRELSTTVSTTLREAMEMANQFPDRKETQKMVGVQLKQSLSQHSVHAVNSLPSNATESIRISKIQEIGLKSKEADAKRKAIEKSDLVARKAKSQPAPLSSWIEKAKKRKLANDDNRTTKEERERGKDLELVMTKSYWSKIKVNGPEGREPLYREVENVMPHLVAPDLRTKTKKILVDLVYAHVKAVVAIGKGEANGITDDSLEGKSEDEIYRCFFKPEKSELLDAVKQERKRRHDARDALIVSCGIGSILDSKYWVEMEFDEMSD